MIAGAPGASGSLLILSSSGETGWNPGPAHAAGTKHIHIANNTMVMPFATEVAGIDSAHAAIRNNSAAALLVSGSRRAGLQYNLFFISGPHYLKKIAQRGVVLLLEHQ